MATSAGRASASDVTSYYKTPCLGEAKHFLASGVAPPSPLLRKPLPVAAGRRRGMLGGVGKPPRPTPCPGARHDRDRAASAEPPQSAVRPGLPCPRAGGRGRRQPLPLPRRAGPG